jgi:AraC-like DNA-binding protein
VASQNKKVPLSPVSGERSLERFSVIFRDLAERCPICRGQSHDVGRCRLLLCVQGEALASFSGKDWHQEMLLTAGCCCINYLPGRFDCLNCTLCGGVQMLELTCPPAQLLHAATGTPVCRALASAFERRRPMLIPQSMSAVLQEILEAMHDAIADPEVNENRDSPAGHVPPETRKAVEKARTILRHRMAEPPPLEALAGEVGMSLSNLKLFFPRVVGLPPYAYLRRARMEQAHELLCQKRLSVTETALTVGYNSLSHFTKTFVAHFGVKPSRAAMQIPSRNGLAEFTGEPNAFMS